jgi:hypothetical protein
MAGCIISPQREYRNRYRREAELALFKTQLGFALSGSESAMNRNGRAASIAINVLMFALWIFFLSCAGAALARILT